MGVLEGFRGWCCPNGSTGCQAGCSGKKAPSSTHLACQHVSLILQAVDERLGEWVTRAHAEFVLQQQLRLKLIILYS